MTYTFTDPEKAKEFEDQVREHGSFGQVARDAVEGFDPFGVKDWVLDHTIGEDVDPEDLPEPDSTYVSAEALIKGEAKAIGNVVIADAGVKGAAPARRRRAGLHVRPGQGQGRAQHQDRRRGWPRTSGLLTFGPEVNGQGRVHRDGHARPGPRLPPVAPEGRRHRGLQRRPPRRRPRAQADRGPDRADPERPEGGQPQERRVRLHRRLRPAGRVPGRAWTSTTDAERADALALFSGNAPAAIAAGDLRRRGWTSRAGSRSRPTTRPPRRPRPG